MDGTPFKFRLARVQSLRQREEEVAQEALAAGLAERRRGELALNDASAHRVRACDHRRGLGAAASGDFLAAQRWIERTERVEQDAALDLDRRDADVEARRVALASAARERQAIDRLADRRRADWQREQSRQAAIALDEIALQTHRRNRGLAA